VKLGDESKIRNVMAGGPGSGPRPSGEEEDDNIPFTEESRSMPTVPKDRPVPEDYQIPFDEEKKKK
jgi:hypothetical protein